MGVVRNNALESINKINSIRASEFLYSTEGRKLIADALIAYEASNSLDEEKLKQVSNLLDNIFDVWRERRLKLDVYR